MKFLSGRFYSAILGPVPRWPSAEQCSAMIQIQLTFAEHLLYAGPTLRHWPSQPHILVVGLRGCSQLFEALFDVQSP